MSKRRPLLSRQRLWQNAERRLTELLVLALGLLRSRATADMVSEGSLNREFYFCLQEANRILHQKRRHLNHLPLPECHNAPDEREREQHKSETKIPDFKWQLIDHQAPARQSARYIDIECKRIGDSGSSSWPLNENYVNNGMNRFLSDEWRYGWTSPIGFMVGYLQNMRHAIVLTHINACAATRGIQALTSSSRQWKNKGVRQLQNSLVRAGSTTPFSLRHFWLDLRCIYDTIKLTSPTSGATVEQRTTS